MTNPHLVQLIHSNGQRRVAIVREPDLVLIRYFNSIFSLAQEALERAISLRTLLEEIPTDGHLAYDDVYEGTADWKLLPAMDHPTDPRFCMISGTGLTHKASAESRQNMHDTKDEPELTDSMRMYRWGLEGGKPEPGHVGVQPEWFYKGNGSLLRGHRDELLVPAFGDDGGEEPELAAVYINDKDGIPHRIGFVTGNEFSDHVMERRNYLYLAPSKLRTCALGPELVLVDHIAEIKGKVSVHRNGAILWEKEIKSGENNMAHSLENLEYHHFKYPNHRVPMDLHVHFLGADAFSFGANIQLADGDEMVVAWESLGRALRNRLRIDNLSERIEPVRQLG